MTDRMGFRALACFLVLGSVAPILLVRLGYLQIGRAQVNRAEVQRQRMLHEARPAPSGTIVDRQGRLLAYDRPTVEVRAEAKLALEEKQERADLDAFVAKHVAGLAAALDADGAADPQRVARREQLRQRIRKAAEKAVAKKSGPGLPPGRYKVDFLVCRDQDSALVLDALRRHDAKHDSVYLHFIHTYVRTYPDRELTFGSVGFVGWRDLASGDTVRVRRGMESFKGLQPRASGEREYWRDADTRSYWTARGVPPARAAVLETTLDLELQRLADEELRRAAAEVTEEYGSPPEWGALCLADIEGEVLAMASYRDGAKPNESAFAPLQSLCEPGSVVKPLVFSIALERGVLDWEHAVIDCTPAYGKTWFVPNSRRPIRDEHVSGELCPRDVIVKSSNIGAVQVGLLLGREGFAQYLESYRFGEATAIGLPGEAAGWLASDRHKGGVRGMPQSEFWVYTAPSLSIGYEYNITPVQLLRAYVTLLNGRPRDLQLYRRYAVGGTVTEVPLPVDGPRFLSERTVARLRDAMRGVVSNEEDATGRHLHAELLEFGAPPLAGKTGTSEIGGKRDGAAVTVRTASFVGFAPPDDPRFVAVCVLQKPGAARFWGGSYAAPATGRLLLHALSQSQVKRPSKPQVSVGSAESVGVPARLAVGR